MIVDPNKFVAVNGLVARGLQEFPILHHKPDPKQDYSTLQVTPDPKAGYSILQAGPIIGRPGIDLDPNDAKALLEALKERAPSNRP